MNQSISNCSAAADRDMTARMMTRSVVAATSGNARDDVNGGRSKDHNRWEQAERETTAHDAMDITYEAKTRTHAKETDTRNGNGATF